MATWQDGPEYAPLERPEGFATPMADPLEDASALPSLTPGATPPPQRIDPVDAPALATLAHQTQPSRDPQKPFGITSSLLTAEPTLSDGRRDPKAPIQVATSALTVGPSEPPPPPPGARPLAAASNGPGAPTTPHASAPPVPGGQTGATHPGPHTRPMQSAPVRPGTPTGPMPSGVPHPAQQYQPVRQWNPQAGQWQQPPPPQRADSSDQIALVAAWICIAGVVAPSGIPLILVLSGIIAALRVPYLKVIGSVTAALGALLLMTRWSTSPSDSLVMLSILLCITIATTIFIARARHRRNDR